MLAIMSRGMDVLTNAPKRMPGLLPATHALWRALAVLLVLFTTVLLPRTALAQDNKSVTWADVDVTVTLREDSTLHITERNRIDFTGGPFRRGYREIPLTRVENIESIKVGELVGERVEPYRQVSPGNFTPNVPNTYTVERVGTVLRVDWSFPPTTSQSRTFELDYDAIGALRVYNDAQTPYEQISWIGVGDELTQSAPVRHAKLTIILPRPVDPGKVFIQGPGSPNPQDHTKDGQTWVWETNNLGEGDSFSAGLQFEPLVPAAKPSWQDTSDAQEQQSATQVEQNGRLNLIFLGLGLLLAAGGA